MGWGQEGLASGSPLSGGGEGKQEVGERGVSWVGGGACASMLWQPRRERWGPRHGEGEGLRRAGCRHGEGEGLRGAGF